VSEPLPPLPQAAEEVLRAAVAPEPTRAQTERLLERLRTSAMAAPPVPTQPGPGSAASAAAGGGLKLVAVAGAALLTGIGGGIALDRAVLPREAPAPLIVEKVRWVERPALEAQPLPAAPSSAPVVPPRPAPAKATAQSEPAGAVDVQLARERELVDTARSAMLRDNADGAIAALQAHATEFPQGRLSEERESLWVQALAQRGDLDEARRRAVAFHRQFPRSLLGATVDAALAAP
jgi:hypothetical protein